MRYSVEVAGKVFTVEIDGRQVRLDGRSVGASLDSKAGSPVRRLAGFKAPRDFVISQAEGGWQLVAEGHRFEAVVLDERARAVRAAARGTSRHGAAGTLRAPMPGRVVRLLARVGQAVEAGQGLVVVEAMKMENELRSPGAGQISKLHVAEGDRVEKGTPLIELA